MATGREEQVGYSLVKDRTITLEKDNEKPDFISIPDYISIVICQNKIIVVDFINGGKVKIHRLHDGKFLDMIDTYSGPRDICLMDATTICVLHDGLIEMASIKSEDMSPVFTRMKRFRLDGVFDWCHSVVRVNDNIVVVGVKQDTTYWCIASLDDGHVDTIHRICKKSIWSYVTTKDNIIYISCDVGYDDNDDCGVYAFDILNPSQCKYKYKHQRLRWPRSIVINKDGNIFVADGGGYYYIYQLTSSCQLVAIFKHQEIPGYLHAMFWDNGRLYVTGSRDITVFRHVHQGSQKESEVLVSDERKILGIDEPAIQISQKNVDNGQSSVETETPPSGPSPADSEDEKQGEYSGQEIVDNGQSKGETEMPPSGPSPEESEDQKQGNHTDSEIPISDEVKQTVIQGTFMHIGQEIPIEQSVEEKLNQAGIKMTTEERELFIQFQNKIGTDIYLSNSLIDGQANDIETERFFEESRPDMRNEWLEYKSQGKLTHELIDAIFALERNPELHAKKDKFLGHMKDLNIIVKARSFDTNGVKEEDYYYTPCKLRPKSEREHITLEQDPRMLSTTLCWDFKLTCIPYYIVDRLLAACIGRWPVARKKGTLEDLISHGYAVFDLDLNHRLTLSFEDNVMFATVTWLVNDDIETPNANLCTIARLFISEKLKKITESLNQDLQYELCLQSPDSRIRFALFQMWIEEKIHDPDSPIKREHINHARLNVALVTVCGKALREILIDNFPKQYSDIYQAILASHAKLTGIGSKRLLNQEQMKLVFPDPKGLKTGTVEMFDLSLLYILIRNVSSVQAPAQGWGHDPLPSDTNLGDSVERIRIYRNTISGHSSDAKMDDTLFEVNWKKFEDVLRDIETVIKRKVYTTDLDNQKGQVISVFNAC